MRLNVRTAIVTLSAAMLLAAPAALADVKLPAVIGENMVLQQGADVPVWGWADPGEKVTVAFAGQTASATADKDGKWAVKLTALKPGEPAAMTVSGKNKLTLKNVLVGEVWVCSGQSNMAWSLSRANNAQQEIAAAKYPKIRLFTVRRATADGPQKDCQGNWVECSPKTAGGFSAVGYFFGRHLHKNLKVPVGLINTSWGGTPAEAWTSLPALKADPFFKPLLDRWDKLLTAPSAKDKYEKAMEAWKKAAAKAKAEKKRLPRKPRPPRDHSKSPHRPANLYNGMIAPLIPYAITGAIWYQGESNAGRAHQYRKLFSAMIVDWRKNWGRGDFTFLWVQLANFMARKGEPAPSAWAELREAQSMALKLPKTGQAVIIDIGEARNIHPKNKQDVGSRLGLAARKIAYGQELCFSGPVYESMTVKGGEVALKFSNTGAGMVAKGGGKLTGFALAGKDKKFVRADAKIQGKDTVVVSSDKVKAPVAVRYAWADNPECNLYNKALLPADPFRTDTWPGITVGKH